MEAKSVIICKNCGKVTNLGGYPIKGLQGAERVVVDTQHPIRCPHCRLRLNPTEQVFLSQLFREQ